VVQTRSRWSIRCEFAFWLATVLFILPATTTSAASTYGGWGLINHSPTYCAWERAHYRAPSNNPAMTFDFNAYIYLEPAASCNHASPWSTFGTNQYGMFSYLWTSTMSYFCDSTPEHIVPSGAQVHGWGKAYLRTAGSCNVSTYYTEAYGATWNGNYSVMSTLLFTV
jgi:hypothetical protein